ncbi:hypothetical protein EV424DRAFT_1399427 [Suillus variegatus]|nr:hypothetical protein EV424DRAFT_1399427 [Suillus variegatus]
MPRGSTLFSAAALSLIIDKHLLMTHLTTVLPHDHSCHNNPGNNIRHYPIIDHLDSGGWKTIMSYRRMNIENCYLAIEFAL